MKQEPTIFDIPRYTIMLESKYYKEFMGYDANEEFIELDSEECLYDDQYVIVVLEPVDPTANYTVEDIMDITGAIAVHEEWTNAIVTQHYHFDELSQIYPWQGGGLTFYGDMMTASEKLKALLSFINKDKTQPVILCDKIMYKIGKDGEYKNLEDKTGLLFGNNITNIKYNNKEEVLYWPALIEDNGYYVAVIDPSLDDDEDDDEPSLLLPMKKAYNDFGPTVWDDEDYYWAEYGYDDYDFRRY